jgi:tRNA 2-selenouridine synthase
MSANSNNFAWIFLNDIPLMDVRAPVEFEKGAFPTSHNLPILDNLQRELIGSRYKEQGQDAAIALGLELATEDIRQQRIERWLQFTRQYPDGYLYCFRGGLRSRTTQSWLKQQGIDYPLVRGGYKAMRRFLLEQLAQNIRTTPWIILTGMTGSGKTRVLRKTAFHIDLEGLANHKGSAFGRNAQDAQPSQISFENALSIALIKYQHQQHSAPLLLEDEGRLIGRIILPPDLFKTMSKAPRIFLERPLQQRVALIRDDYIDRNWPHYQCYGSQAEDKFRHYVLDNLARIKNRLGGVRYQQIHTAFEQALKHFFATGDSELFCPPITILLTEYYDPMYHYQLEKKPVDIIFKGPEDDILQWLQHTTGAVA